MGVFQHTHGGFEGTYYTHPDYPPSTVECRKVRRYVCGHWWWRYSCTRRRGHIGDHVSHTNRWQDPPLEVARWRPANPYGELEIGPDTDA